MTRDWTKRTPVMQRTFADDVKGAVFVLIGGAIGCLVFAGGDFSFLLGGVVGLVLAIVVLNVVRRVARRRHT